MPSPRRRRSSRSGTRRKPMFWVTNSITPSLLVPTGTSVADMFGGTIPKDRDALRRMTVKRMLLQVRASAETIGVDASISVGVFEGTQNLFAGSSFPEPGEEEIGFYYSAEGDWRQSLISDSSQWFQKEVDIRSARALRGADRTLFLTFKNAGVGVNLVIYANWKLLVSYG